MNIIIAERFRPFVHSPGVPCLLPYSTLSFQIYPAHIKVFDLSFAKPSLVAEFALHVQGPVKGFTVLQDLEKGCLKVWGESLQGFFRYRIEPKLGCAKEFTMISEKMPEILPEAYRDKVNDFEVSGIERLSFGVTKKADWDLVLRRSTLAEILPFWFRLGQMLPDVTSHKAGSACLLSDVGEALLSKDSLHLATSFKNLFLAGFEGLLSPTLTDHMHQGFILPFVAADCSHSPLLLLTKGAKLIRQMLVDVEETTVDILSCLMPELHAGRFCQISLGDKGCLDLEWSKKQARRLIFRSAKVQTLTFNFQKDLKSFRLRNAASASATIKTCGEPIAFASGNYFLDNFQG